VAKVPTHYADLANYLGDHVETEAKALGTYERLIEERQDDVVGYLISMILEDEKRHHQMFFDMRETLLAAMQWREPEGGIPRMRIKGDVDRLVEVTSELLDRELDDERELKRLSKEWSSQRGDRALWGLLVSTAQLDTKKHITILRYLLAELKKAS
jgi:hypothetical protein